MEESKTNMVTSLRRIQQTSQNPVEDRGLCSKTDILPRYESNVCRGEEKSPQRLLSKKNRNILNWAKYIIGIEDVMLEKPLSVSAEVKGSYSSENTLMERPMTNDKFMHGDDLPRRFRRSNQPRMGLRTAPVNNEKKIRTRIITVLPKRIEHVKKPQCLAPVINTKPETCRETCSKGKSHDKVKGAQPLPQMKKAWGRIRKGLQHLLKVCNVCCR